MTQTLVAQYLSCRPGGRTPRQLIRRALVRTLPRRRFLVVGPTDRAEICLTFDDGPHPEHTPAVLDVLARYGVSATFFLVGARAGQYPELVRRIKAEGHAIGHHSYSHSNPEATSARQLLAEVAMTRDLLQGLTGKAPDLFRPPHGKLTVIKLFGLWRAGQRVVLWNWDPKDFACSGDSQLRQRLAADPPRAGDVLLLHDNVGHTASILPELIDTVRARNISFVTVRSWML